MLSRRGIRYACARVASYCPYKEIRGALSAIFAPIYRVSYGKRGDVDGIGGGLRASARSRAAKKRGKTQLALVVHDANFNITFRCGPEVLDLWRRGPYVVAPVECRWIHFPFADKVLRILAATFYSLLPRPSLPPALSRPSAPGINIPKSELYGLLMSANERILGGSLFSHTLVSTFFSFFGSFFVMQNMPFYDHIPSRRSEWRYDILYSKAIYNNVK